MAYSNVDMIKKKLHPLLCPVMSSCMSSRGLPYRYPVCVWVCVKLFCFYSQFNKAGTFETVWQAKYYNYYKREHCQFGNNFGSIDYECKPNETRTLMWINKESFNWAGSLSKSSSRTADCPLHWSPLGYFFAFSFSSKGAFGSFTQTTDRASFTVTLLFELTGFTQRRLKVLFLFWKHILLTLFFSLQCLK